MLGYAFYKATYLLIAYSIYKRYMLALSLFYSLYYNYKREYAPYNVYALTFFALYYLVSDYSLSNYTL